jgi:hypothetical protein
MKTKTTTKTTAKKAVTKTVKTSAQIKAYILKNGAKLTNPQMVAMLEVPTMTFAGVLAGMKRNKEIKNNFLKTDLQKRK